MPTIARCPGIRGHVRTDARWEVHESGLVWNEAQQLLGGGADHTELVRIIEEATGTRLCAGERAAIKEQVGMNTRHVAVGSVAAVLSAVAAAAWGQSSESASTFPDRPLRILVGYTPGGGTDILARAIGQKLSESFGKPVVIENRPGASTMLATEMLAKAAPDGHTMAMATATHALNTSFYPKLPYDPIRDFSAVIFVASIPNVLLLHPSVPAKSVKEFIAYAKGRPGQINYGSTGHGGPYHLAAELFNALAGTQMVHVPYKGAAPAGIGLMAGEVSVMFGNVVSMMPHVKTGKLRALAVTSARRSATFPSLPTIAEAALPDYEFTSWFGLLAPAKVPMPIITKLNAEAQKALDSPDLKQRFFNEGSDLIGGPPQRFMDHIKVETARWARIIKDANIKVQ